MKLRRTHRRLAVLMGIAGVLAFLSGAGVEALAAPPALLVLSIALFWQFSPVGTVRLERVLLAASVALAARALYHVFIIPDDVVIPMADLLLVLLAGEALKNASANNDTRLYSLSFALLIAATAYRPSIIFGLAFLAYTGLATVALMVGHVRRQAEKHGQREPGMTRGFLWRMASLSSVALVMSALLFVTFPRVSRGWASRVVQEERAIVGFGDAVSLDEHGSRIYSNPEIVLRVEFPDGRPAGVEQLYWRGRSYDHFDGVRWARSPSMPLSAASVPYLSGWSQGGGVRQMIYAAPIDAHVIFGLHPIFSIRPRSRIRPFMDESGDFSYFGSVAPVYEVASFGERPAAGELREAGESRSPAPDHYLQLPEISARMRRLADSLTAGHESRYDKVMAVQRYLHTFAYTLELPATARQATLDYFLFRRQEGHCEYFSTAMAILLRSAGIPARNVNGFLGGNWNAFGNYLAVTQNSAHSWVEVWFPGYNWVPFDPTPAAGPGEGARLETQWYWPMRFMFDGVEHRWDKWILDYDLEKQVDLFRRTADQFSRDPAAPGRSTPGASGNLLRWTLVLAAIALVVALARGIRRPRTSASTRTYLRLRRAYGRAGYADTPVTPPLTFLERLRQEHAPGIAHAERAVDLYVRARFAEEDIGESGRRELEREVKAAKDELRRARREKVRT